MSIVPLLVSGLQGYFGGCGIFIELDDDIYDNLLSINLQNIRLKKPEI